MFLISTKQFKKRFLKEEIELFLLLLVLWSKNLYFSFCRGVLYSSSKQEMKLCKHLFLKSCKILLSGDLLWINTFWFKNWTTCGKYWTLNLVYNANSITKMVNSRTRTISKRRRTKKLVSWHFLWLNIKCLSALFSSILLRN